MRRELLRAAGDRGTVTYGSLMRKFRLSRGAPGGKGVVGVVGEVDRREARRGAPGFAAIAAKVEPHLRLGRVDTEAEQTPAISR